MQDMNKKYGNVYLVELTKLIFKRAEENGLSYSNPKENQWNMWLENSRLVLSFISYKGKMITCLVGTRKETLEKFYLANLVQVDMFLKKYIEYYFKELEKIYAPTLPDFDYVDHEEVKGLVRRKKIKKTQVDGQLSFKDMGWEI